MPDLKILPFANAHLTGAAALAALAGWPHGPGDWQMLLPFSRGVVAMAGGAVVGTALRSDFGPDQSTINMVIVHQDMRGQGLGRQLVQAAMGAGPRAFRLVATEYGRPLYEKLGFRPVARVAKHQGRVGVLPASPAGPLVVAPAQPGDLAAITALESAAFGADRSAQVDWLAGQGALAVLRDQGRVSGYAACRAFGGGHVIGPVVATCPQDARALILHHLQRCAGQIVRLDLLQDGGLGRWLTDLGLPLTDQPPVMALGDYTATPQRMALFSQALA